MIVVPQSWLSWNFELQGADGARSGELRFATWRERGSVVVEGLAYSIYRREFLGPFILEAPDGVAAASATKPSAFRREFLVESGSGSLVLRAHSPFLRRCDVLRGDERIGTIEPIAWPSRRAKADIADDVSPALQAFLIWLTLLLWKRDASG